LPAGETKNALNERAERSMKPATKPDSTCMRSARKVNPGHDKVKGSAMRRVFLLIMMMLVVAAPAAAKTQYWFLKDTRVDATPALLAQFNRDRIICDGKAAEAVLGGQRKGIFEQRKLANLIFDGCLYERGYEKR
jgi:hypothetical protein